MFVHCQFDGQSCRGGGEQAQQTHAGGRGQGARLVDRAENKLVGARRAVGAGVGHPEHVAHRCARAAGAGGRQARLSPRDGAVPVGAEIRHEDGSEGDDDVAYCSAGGFYGFLDVFW